ncbi:MAG: tRNA dihydrouridine(20/20a) synthase DusA, partial [Acidithiobacillus sp.]
RRETLPEPEVILSGLIAYAERWGEGLPAPRLSRHLHGLRFGQCGAGAWRRFLGTAEPGESAATFLRRGMSLLD